MNKTNELDYFNLDGRLLRLFVMVYEEGSVTRAAERLGINQSAVSHSSEKLRIILNDPLFIRSGRGIVVTKRAEILLKDARKLLSGMRRMTEGEKFNPKEIKRRLVVAAAGFQRDLLLPQFFAQLQIDAPGIELKIINSDVSDATLLREEQCDLVISPNPPEGAEFMQQRIFEDQFVCFYDPEVVVAPKNLTEFLQKKQLKVVFSNNESTLIDKLLNKKGRHRKIILQVPSFSALPFFMRGQDVIAIQPSLLKHTILKEFETCPCPFRVSSLPFYQIWHAKNNDDSLHLWIRKLLREEAQKLIGR